MEIRWPRPNRRFGMLDALGLLGALGLSVARWVPVAKLPFWGCPFRRLTGWPCPGCGLTRAADRFAHGNFLGAWHADPMGTVAAFLFALAAGYALVHLAFGAPVPDLRLSERETFWLRWTLLLALVVNYAFVIATTRFPRVLG